jgi:hypothetical protein
LEAFRRKCKTKRGIYKNKRGEKIIKQTRIKRKKEK